MLPVVQRSFVDVPEAPLLIDFVLLALAGVNSFLVEVRLQASSGVKVDDVLQVPIVLPQLVALHCVTAKQQNRRVSRFRHVPTRLTVLDSNVPLPAQSEELRRVRLHFVGGAEVQADPLLLAMAQSVDAERRIRQRLNRSRSEICKFEVSIEILPFPSRFELTWRVDRRILVDQVRRHLLDEPAERLALQLLPDRFLLR